MNELIETYPQKQYKDRLFKAIFGRDTQQSKEWRLELYNALNDTNYTDPDALELNTIENVIYLTMKNDVSFLIDSQMTLFEQQSTYNPNMPLRGLMYFAQLYQMYLSKNGKTLHRTSLVKIPCPQFVVFYNGEKECPDTVKLHLSDSFEKPTSPGEFEWTATMININRNHNESLQKKCRPLYNYVQYVTRISDNKKNGMPAKQAVNEAVDWAINRNLLNGLFKIQKQEVLSMSLTEFDEEEFKRDMRNEGREEKTIEAARSFYANGVSVELIAKSLDMTPEQVKEIVQDVVVVG